MPSQAPPSGDGARRPLSKGQLELLLSYMRDMVAAVKDAVSKGMTLDQAKQTIDLSKYSSIPGFAAGNPLAIERAYNEITGKPME
ncbi:MAG: hypothetical protein ACLP1Y_11250 [Candidatus Acidiferrales bacterium]